MKAPLKRAWRWLRGDTQIAMIYLLPGQKLGEIKTSVPNHYSERDGNVVTVFSNGPVSGVSETVFFLDAT